MLYNLYARTDFMLLQHNNLAGISMPFRPAESVGRPVDVGNVSQTVLRIDRFAYASLKGTPIQS